MKILVKIIATCKSCPYYRKTNDWKQSDYCIKSSRTMLENFHGVSESDTIPDWCELEDVKL